MKRRSFLSGLAGATAAPLLPRLAAAAPAPVALGLDNFAVRAMGWKAPELITYAAAQKCDVLLISDLDAVGPLGDAELRAVRRQADAAGLGLYVGSWSICPTSKAFRPTWGTAEEHVRLGLRVARALGSPVFRVVLGNMEDRKTPGGIRARMADTLAVIRACRRDILASGVRLALENHAGDLHSWELRSLIDEAGHDLVGANLDTGNAFWTLEDPMDVLETLGPVALCSSLRDAMVWEAPDGATMQWTAAGEGLLDWRALADRWRALCPRTPVIIETISGNPRTFAYRQPSFWEHYDRRPEKLARFEALAKRGKPIPAFKAPAGPDGRAATQNFQRAELERSLAYLRTTIGLGGRA